MRRLLTFVCLIGVVAAVTPALAVAGGPSAGDQQYVDPLGGSHHKSSSSSTTTATPTPAPSTSPTPVAGTSSATTSATTTSSTTSTATPATTSSAGGKSLPFTGFDAWAGAGIGACLLAAGIGLRLTTRRSARRRV